LVWVGRAATVVLMVLSAGLALMMTNAKDNFDIMLGVGAGTGLVYLMRWFWWRVNAWSEVSAMIAALVAFLYFRFFHGWYFALEVAGYWQFAWIALLTTVAWVVTTLLTPPDDEQTLRRFYRLAKPGGPGWQAVVARAATDGQPIDDGRGWSVPTGLLCTMLGCLAVYGALFGTGYALAGHEHAAAILLTVAVVALITVLVVWRRSLAD